MYFSIKYIILYIAIRVSRLNIVRVRLQLKFDSLLEVTKFKHYSTIYSIYYIGMYNINMKILNINDQIPSNKICKNTSVINITTL